MHDYMGNLGMPGEQFAKMAAAPPSPSLQETVVQTLGKLREAHNFLDDMEGAPSESKTQPTDQVGLVEAVSTTQALAVALVQRLMNLRNRLGRL